ncbi:hypothetical protein [Arthrobacter woluwensis]|uniref:Uncharacterized protein n=1 Tax=Arthrobacter woluwensis TaxID=156980 RepID=A0A1H4JX74_9MICC|nr:hypothetical protein [Arthrobacter woluwensis]SEB50773.1 hypothetical protein SAMN04489745_0434 [Arthrobacter woluwensis]
MSISMRLEFEIDDLGSGGSKVRDLREWLKVAEQNGADDDDDLFVLRDERGDMTGFYMYVLPEGD